MNEPSVDVEKIKLHDIKSHYGDLMKCFKIEQNIFGETYKTCPKDFTSFLSFFKKDCLKFTVYVNDILLGLAFLDVLNEQQNVYYLRVAGITKEKHNQGIGTVLINSIVQALPPKSSIIFVSEHEQLKDLFCKNINIKSKDRLEESMRILLTEYNPKLVNVSVGSILENYYEKSHGGSGNGKLFAMEKLNE